MTDPERGDEGGAGENMSDNDRVDKELSPSTAVDLHDDQGADDSKVGLINGNGGAGTDHIDVRIQDPAAASSDGEVSFNGLGKDEVMRYADEPFWKRLRLILFIIFWAGWFAMLITAVVIIALAPRCPPRPDLKWYQTDAVYQVIPKSFKDSNADGRGDFEGLKSKMSHIEGLGANAVWLSDFYKSEDPEDVRSSRYGIMDHMEIRPDFEATQSEVKSWIKKLTKEGKRVILDLIPNQTSKKHEWFLKSQKKEGKYTNYYIWKPTSPAEPTSWKTVDSVDTAGSPESAWTKDKARANEWYFHQHAGEYPDLNLTNPDVVDEIKKIMKFWLDAGVGGFHVCDVNLLVEDHTDDASDPRDNVATRTFLEELRAYVDTFNKPGREKFLFATVHSSVGNLTKHYGDAKKGLNIVMPVMKTLEASTDATALRDIIIGAGLDEKATWLGRGLGDQHTSRVASRLGGSAQKLNAAHALQLLLPGTPFTYYGDEFGQLTGDDSKVTQQDHYISPMQWNNQKNAGFSTGKPWQQVGSKYMTNNVMAGTAHFTTITPLKAFKDLVQLRKEPSFQWGKTEVCASNPSVLMFSRKATRFPFYAVLVNLDGQSGSTKMVSLADSCVASKPEGTVRFHSGDSDQVGQTLNFHDHPASIKPGEVVVIEFAADEE